MRFSRAFKVRASINRVFELTEEFFSETNFQVENRVNPGLLVLSRGNISGSLLDFNIQRVKTLLTISFSETDEDVQVHCVYETRYGRLITSRDKAVFDNEVDKLKKFLATAVQS